MRKAIFLDRDGVINRPLMINRKSHAPASLQDFELLPNVPDALQALKAANFLLFIVTNQPDVGKGIHIQHNIEQIHHFLLENLPIDDIFVCFHTDHDRCSCRKPLPGLLQQAAIKYPIDFTQSFLIGDRWKDIAAGTQMGCTTFFIDYDYDEPKPEQTDYIVNSLMEAKNIILGVKNARTTSIKD